MLLILITIDYFLRKLQQIKEEAKYSLHKYSSPIFFLQAVPSNSINRSCGMPHLLIGERCVTMSQDIKINVSNFSDANQYKGFNSTDKMEAILFLKKIVLV